MNRRLLFFCERQIGLRQGFGLPVIAVNSLGRGRGIDYKKICADQTKQLKRIISPACRITMLSMT
ncbi:hypothetical protein [Methylomicrobium sp. Wu6]|uniref:hypothetical protein n=1 Tax=Methylomicrobium sp. Wu6 TaxID=3107928 RepID=UPI002DD62DCA|nr:hypothetical protein [Methylomicrobium sp. Wu6]MEC4750503.1 hypothetical protein [Methylomicrobium sp. Wu6]